MNFDGFTTKMRVKKEITTFKVIGLHIYGELSGSNIDVAANSIDFKAKLEDL